MLIRRSLQSLVLPVSFLGGAIRSLGSAAPSSSRSDFREDEVDEKGQRKRPGSVKPQEDAFGHADPMAAIQQSMSEAKQMQENAAQLNEPEIDQVASSLNRRRNKQKRSMDHVLGEVLNDALRLRDMGEKPDMDFIYKQTQDRVYEAEHGRKPPSRKEQNAKYIPFPPDFRLIRLLPNTMFENDPWPERSITLDNPVLSVHEAEKDKRENEGRILKSQEVMFQPREGRDPIDEFGDAVDELTYWEHNFLDFVRDAPIGLRRTLPLLHEYYRGLTHRLIRAEKRFLQTRDVAMSRAKISAETFKLTEDRIERVRGFYAETHKSLSSPNYDPIKMKKGPIGKIMALKKKEYLEWKKQEERQRDVLIAAFSP